MGPGTSIRNGNAAVGHARAGAATAKSEYRKDSTDRQRQVAYWLSTVQYDRTLLIASHCGSVITQALFQEAQRERIRTADRDGKDEVIYLAGNASAHSALEWTVTCDLDFYSKAYGTIRGCTPSAPEFCRRIVHDSFAPESHCRVLREATEDAMYNLFHRCAYARALLRMHAWPHSTRAMLLTRSCAGVARRVSRRCTRRAPCDLV